MHGIHPFLKNMTIPSQSTSLQHNNSSTVHNTFIVYSGSARFLHLGGSKLGIVETKWSPVISPDRVCGGQSLPEAEALLLSACLIKHLVQTYTSLYAHSKFIAYAVVLPLARKNSPDL